jgi:hypothetical protein
MQITSSLEDMRPVIAAKLHDYFELTTSTSCDTSEHALLTARLQLASNLTLHPAVCDTFIDKRRFVQVIGR